MQSKHIKGLLSIEQLEAVSLDVGIASVLSHVHGDPVTDDFNY